MSTSLNREALEARAIELEIKFPSNFKDETLAKKINDAEEILDALVNPVVEPMGHALAVPQIEGAANDAVVFQVTSGKRKGTYKVSEAVTIVRN